MIKSVMILNIWNIYILECVAKFKCSLVSNQKIQSLFILENFCPIIFQQLKFDNRKQTKLFHSILSSMTMKKWHNFSLYIVPHEYWPYKLVNYLVATLDNTDDAYFPALCLFS